MNTKSFEQSIIDCTPLLHKVAFKLTHDSDEARDLVQETMLRALRHREKFAEGSRLEAWLYTILRNNYINRYRKQQNHQKAKKLLSYEAKPRQTVANESWGRMLVKTVRHHLESLPAIYRHPLQLIIAGYQYQEIAVMTGEPLGTIKSRVHSGRMLLRRSLQGLVD